MRRIQAGLRLAGLRDHAEEGADFGVPEITEPHADLIGRTPTLVRGAKTIRTDELADLMARQEPILIDVALRSWGRSIPGAIGLQGTGHAAGFSDNHRIRLSRKVQELTNDDLIGTHCRFLRQRRALHRL